MKTHAILSALGHDRVGVADDLAAALAERRVDIEGSRMTALGGQFALIVHLSGEEKNLTRLRHELPTIGKNLGFHLLLEPMATPRPMDRTPQFLIESYSPGPSGIGAVTAVFKRHDINIEELETDAASAPWTSAIAFRMRARVTIPPSYSVTALREELRELERERDLDIVIKPIPASASSE